MSKSFYHFNIKQSILIPLFIFNIYDGDEYPIKIFIFLLCLLISLACQIGDLFISYLKRKAKVKDTGKILPSRITSVSQFKQRELSTAIKRAKVLGLI